MNNKEQRSLSSIPHPSWYPYVQNEFEKDYMRRLHQFLKKKEQDRIICYPKRSRMFYALRVTPLDAIKVVILGQDPYPGKNQANGLAFSVDAGITFPASLKNIIQELVDDQQLPYPTSGDLTPWAKQGVLLLNTILTVDAGQPASHRNQGWETFTDFLIQLINQQCDHVFFILWGNHARTKQSMILSQKHGVFTSVHPSPLSVHRGFFGSKPFDKANQFLINHHISPIDWQLH